MSPLLLLSFFFIFKFFFSFSSCGSILGIPYAVPPVGSLRFLPPISLVEFVEPLGEYGPICVQTGNRMGSIPLNISEDCLTLNIFSPSASESNSGVLLPVMVWIHGGAFQFGAAAQYSAQKLSQTGNVIVVTLNYRLGALGFLAVRSNSSVGNLGFLDQVAALHWINRFIERFSGDPQRVTIFGESAGAYSVSAHLTSPLSVGLFSSAIIESGPAASRGAFQSQAQAEKYSEIWLNKFAPHCQLSDFACLQELPQSTFSQIILPFPSSDTFLPQVGAPYIFPFGLVVDNFSLLDFPMSSILNGKFHPVPTLLGFNHNEGGSAIVDAFTHLHEQFPNISFPYQWNDVELFLQFSLFFDDFPMNEKFTESVMAAYQQADFPSAIAYLSRVWTDGVFACSTRLMADSLVRSFSSPAPVYLYEFSYSNSTWPQYLHAGDFHSFDIYFVFQMDGFNQKLSSIDISMSEEIQNYWTQFAWSHSPNQQNSNFSNILWPSFSTGENIILAEPSKVHIDQRDSLCKNLWNPIYEWERNNPIKSI